MKIKNITRRALTLDFSRKVFIRAGAELHINSAQAKKAQVYQHRGLIRIMGEEGAKIVEVAQKVTQEPIPTLIPEPAPEPALKVEEVVVTPPVLEDPETGPVDPEEEKVDLDSLDYQALKELGDTLDIKERGKTKLLAALKEHYS